jgi:hypothetical protein
MSHVWTHPVTGGRLFVGGFVSGAASLTEARITNVVSLVEIGPDTAAAIAAGGTHGCFPIKDIRQLPDARAERGAVQVIVSGLEAGDGVLVHCQGGVNRAPYIGARALIALGLEPSEAVRAIARVRGRHILSNHTFLVGLLGGPGAAAWQIEARH